MTGAGYDGGMSVDLGGVAFDLDGTLYPNYRLYARLIPFIIREHRLLLAFGRARDTLRGWPAGEMPPGYRFYREQARLIGAALGEEASVAEKRIEQLIYRGWEPLFTRIKPYRDVRQTLERLRAGGLKLGILSDFPPDTKLANMGLGGLWDTLLCSEVLGRLKPDPIPFRELVDRMGLPPERILYVGNSVSYDIIGAKREGLKTALIRPSWWKGGDGNADFVFSGYRQLSAYVLPLT